MLIGYGGGLGNSALGIFLIWCNVMVRYGARQISLYLFTLSFSVMNSNLTDIIVGAVTWISPLKNSSVEIVTTISKEALNFDILALNASLYGAVKCIKYPLFPIVPYYALSCIIVRMTIIPC